MGLFKRKPKRHVPTDLERELALATRLQNKKIRDAETKLKLKELQLEELELDSQMAELTGDDEGGMFGLGKEEMQLLDILTKAGVVGNAQKQTGDIPSSPLSSETESTPIEAYSDSSSGLLSKLPKPLLKQLKNIPKEELHKAVDEL